ncbi:type VI secretion system membrane subunit TssM [Gallaecimonas kandeliae]|uniref:type VI secretion system membrane subunit TssM n=1 Tax=Gallaecimonas kandeliae TaxID=3029055 RepID=UPI0026473F41|nr:type VI secretion system membrane subunit TssM [Gallaecimonas kandeliae]WKE65745.1 type VI secretion system membrane subunit TssM [Gallaecimonas kandeliae]
MTWIRRLGAGLGSRKVILALGALAIILLTWFGGPLVAIAGWEPLASVAARILFLVTLALLVLGWQLWRLKREKQANELVVNEMLTPSSNDDALLSEEVEALRNNMKDALALVKKWRPGRFKSVYELPWYMIIGAPGSGKSTALLNSGLEFPLKDEMGIDAVKGVGGTRHCDWWFTNKAVLIDTAGRYTTQDSADKRDAKGWNSFLGLLKKNRPRRPINGVLLAVSVADLLEQTPTERLLHARAIKQRVQELKNRLGLVFPVYVVLTKFDLLEGFNETFGLLSEQERQEAFGITFPLQAVRSPQTLPQAFEAEFDALQQRLGRFVLHKMQQERNPAAQRRIYQFPKQLALLQAPLWDLLKEVFFPSAYEEVPLLRGIYLVSSEQSGQAMDKIAKLVDNHYRLQPAPAKTAMASHDSFFLRRLFDDIVFSEHNLASADLNHEKKFIWVRRAAMASALLATVGLTSGWYLSYGWNSRLIQAYQAQLSALSLDLQDKDLDWVKLNRLLGGVASMPGVLHQPMPAGGPQQLGLFQGERLGQAAEGAYGRLLQGQFADALKASLEQEIAGNLNHLEYLYETLKTYLMLADRSHLDEDQVHAWFELMLERRLPGQINEPIRNQLNEHLRRYLKMSPPLALDQKLVADARAELTALPLAERAYQRIKVDSDASRLPDFRLPLALGSVAEGVFERRSGTSLQQGIPGLYTRNGYQAVFLPEKDKIVKRLIEDSWVYGENDADFRNLDEDVIEAGVSERYFRDYIYVWNNFLDDLRLKPFNSALDGARIAGLLSGPEAPIGRLFALVKKNTQLTDPEQSKVGAVADKAKDAALNRLSQRKRELSGLVDLAANDNAQPQKTPVEKAFEALNRVKPETFDRLQADTKVAARYFEQQGGMTRAHAIATVDRGQFDDALRDFYSAIRDSESDRLDHLAGDFLGDSRQVVKLSETRQINDIWRGSVYGDYRRAIAGKYPFRRQAKSEVALQDFGDFFGYGGVLDKFFQEHLSSYVDTSRSPWRLTKDLGISEQSLHLFEEAQKIREVFFPPGSRTPRLSFSLKPRSLDQRVSQFMLEIDGQNLTYRHGPTRLTKFNWPENAGEQMTRVVFNPSQETTPVAASYQGPWAIFRMLQDAGHISSQDRHQIVQLQVKDFEAKLELVTSSVKNPFTTALLESFQLPRTL